MAWFVAVLAGVVAVAAAEVARWEKDPASDPLHGDKIWGGLRVEILEEQGGVEVVDVRSSVIYPLCIYNLSYTQRIHHTHDHLLFHLRGHPSEGDSHRWNGRKGKSNLALGGTQGSRSGLQYQIPSLLGPPIHLLSKRENPVLSLGLKEAFHLPSEPGKFTLCLKETQEIVYRDCFLGRQVKASCSLTSTHIQRTLPSVCGHLTRHVASRFLNLYPWSSCGRFTSNWLKQPCRSVKSGGPFPVVSLEGSVVSPLSYGDDVETSDVSLLEV